MINIMQKDLESSFALLGRLFHFIILSPYLFIIMSTNSYILIYDISEVSYYPLNSILFLVYIGHYELRCILTSRCTYILCTCISYLTHNKFVIK